MAVCALSGGPLRAEGPAAFCGATGPGGDGRFPAPSELLRASLAAEAILAGPREPLLGDNALALLEVPASDMARPDPATLAAYCSAAGEAMRLARSGSAARAQVYLRSALAAASSAADEALTAQIAYRLALVSSRLPVRPNSRSVLRASSDRLEPLSLPSGEAVFNPEDACSVLRSAPLDEESRWAASQLAINCAARSGSEAGVSVLVSVAYLQGARISLSEAARRSFDRTRLRRDAASSALAGLEATAGIRAPGERFTLAARLIETLIETGEGGSAEIDRQIAVLAAFAKAIDPAGGNVDQRAQIEGLRARAALLRDDRAEAAEHARLALFYESQRANPLRLPDWYMVLASAVPAQREDYVLEAYAALEAIRPLLPQIDPLTEESTFSLRMEPIFRAAVDILLANEEAESAPAGAGRILAAQTILESFRQAEIQSVFGADCVPPRVPVSPADLRTGEVLLYPVLLEDRIELIFAAKQDATTRPSYQRVTVREAASRETIEALVKETVFELGYGQDDTWEILAGDLYKVLIEPIEGLLGPETTLVIVPDGILRRLPFAALRDEDGTLLIEKTLLTIAPSLAYTQPGTSRDASSAVVSASLSQSVDLPAGTFAALPATAAEAQMAARVAPRGGREQGIYLPDFTRADLASAFAVAPIDILHLATHASFNGRSDRSFVVSSDGAILLSELRQLIENSQIGGELLTLIVLSACETALGDDQASMGLAGAAVQAGAQSALASLWEVSDEGTARLMEEFYRNYAAGKGRARALREAQLALIRSDGELADPRVWAAFILLGAWR